MARVLTARNLPGQSLNVPAKPLAFDEKLCNDPLMRHGFSLVELSIVLVILGLLTGGILAGQSLIRAAELRSVTTEFNRYLSATQTFRDKYFALPGDMGNATAFWGKDTTNCNGDTGSAGIPGTCNGNANGGVGFGPESFRYWQQLALAGLIEGSYTGVTAGAFAATVSSANAPKGKLANSLWWGYELTPDCTGGSCGTYFDGSYGNTYQFGGAVTGGDNYNPILKPEEAWNIDTKMDDGLPVQGKMIIRAAVGGWGACTNATSAASLNATYNFTNTSLACTVEFRKLF